jgi:hypothetical protein
MTSKRLKAYCDYAKQEVEFSLFQLKGWKDAYGVACHGPGKEKPCRGERGCALYEKFWFDGSIANVKQQAILKEAHRKGKWDEKCSEWLTKSKKRHRRE